MSGSSFIEPGILPDLAAWHGVDSKNRSSRRKEALTLGLEESGRKEKNEPRYLGCYKKRIGPHGS
jgi:hypothetical protein